MHKIGADFFSPSHITFAGAPLVHFYLLVLNELTQTFIYEVCGMELNYVPFSMCDIDDFHCGLRGHILLHWVYKQPYCSQDRTVAVL